MRSQGAKQASPPGTIAHFRWRGGTILSTIPQAQNLCAWMAELADAGDSKSPARKGFRVRPSV